MATIGKLFRMRDLGGGEGSDCLIAIMEKYLIKNLFKINYFLSETAQFLMVAHKTNPGRTLG